MRPALLALLFAVPAVAQPVLTLTSPDPQPFALFGVAVAGVGDADGDGRGDLLVGAPSEDLTIGGTVYGNAGQAYLYSGRTGALLHALRSPNLDADEGEGSFASDVSGVPDVDGDGRGDLLVGAVVEDVGGVESAGRAYLFSGATGARLRTLQSPNSQLFGGFGDDVSGVPDVDGDGRGDLLVGAYPEDVGEMEDAGRAYLFSGATGALLRTLQSPNPELFGEFGQAVSGVPDADGDGRGDLLVGAYTEGPGRAYLYSGATGALLRTLTSPNPEANSFFGFAISGVADADGDGRGDLLVGAPGENGGATDAGRAYLYSGASGALLRTLESPNPEFEFFPDVSSAFGFAVSGVPDLDGDGRGDLLVGAYGEDARADDAGRAYVFSGASGALLATLTSPNAEEQEDGALGLAVAGVPDADGDGGGDLLVGAYFERAGGPFNTGAGRAYLFRSGDELAVTATGTPTTIPPGGTVIVTATISNNISAPVTGDLWVVVERNGAPVLTRLIGSGTLPAGATVTRQFPLRAPSATPPGTYTINVNVGRFPNAVAASDAFDVTVTGGALAGAPASEPFVVAPIPGDVFATEGPVSAAVPPSPSVAVSPNPFAGRTALRFVLVEAGAVRLSVHDALGREVAVLADGPFEAGAHTAPFDARGLPGGVYLVRLTAGGLAQTQRVTLVR